MKKLLIGGIALLSVVSLTACGELGADDEEGLGDAPIGQRHEAPRQVWVMPNLFPNISGVCIGKDFVLVTTREAPPVVLNDSEICA